MSKDILKPWHDHLNYVRQREKDGTLKFSKPMEDYDLAIAFAAGIAYREGYKTVTAEMLFHLVKAFTDVCLD